MQSRESAAGDSASSGGFMGGGASSSINSNRMIPYDNEMHQKVMNMIYEDANDRKSSETR